MGGAGAAGRGSGGQWRGARGASLDELERRGDGAGPEAAAGAAARAGCARREGSWRGGRRDGVPRPRAERGVPGRRDVRSGRCVVGGWHTGPGEGGAVPARCGAEPAACGGIPGGCSELAVQSSMAVATSRPGGSWRRPGWCRQAAAEQITVGGRAMRPGSARPAASAGSAGGRRRAAGAVADARGVAMLPGRCAAAAPRPPASGAELETTGPGEVGTSGWPRLGCVFDVPSRIAAVLAEQIMAASGGKRRRRRGRCAVVRRRHRRQPRGTMAAPSSARPGAATRAMSAPGSRWSTATTTRSA